MFEYGPLELPNTSECIIRIESKKVDNEFFLSENSMF